MENLNERVQKFNTAIQSVKTQLRRDLVGQDEVVDNVIIAIIAGGNVLLEGIPGVGKTRLVRSLGKTLNLPFSRIQFTPDLMPSLCQPGPGRRDQPRHPQDPIGHAGGHAGA